MRVSTDSPRPKVPPAPRLRVRLAVDEADRLAAQRLRYDVFVTELGAETPTADHVTRREGDALDEHADHLVLVDQTRDPAGLDHVVGVYRLMTDTAAQSAGGFYCAQEFDLSPLVQSGKRLVELGRSCVHPDFRRGAAMLLLWNGVAEYVIARGIEVMFGAASFPGIDPQAHAQALGHLHRAHLAPETLRVRAIGAGATRMDLMPEEALDPDRALAAMPPLIRAYLKLGGMVGQGAFVDLQFKTVDVCLIMDTATMSGKAVDFYTRKSPR